MGVLLSVSTGRVFSLASDLHSARSRDVAKAARVGRKLAVIGLTGTAQSGERRRYFNRHNNRFSRHVASGDR